MYRNITEATTHRIVALCVDPDFPADILRNMGFIHQAALEWLFNVPHIEDYNALYYNPMLATLDGGESVEVMVYAKVRAYLRKQDSIAWYMAVVRPESAAYIENLPAEGRNSAVADLVMMPTSIRQVWETVY